MKENSEQFTTILIEGKEEEFHDLVLDTIKSLDQAQQTARKAYNLSLTREITDD